MTQGQRLINRLSFKFRVNCQCKYNFSEDGKKVTPRRDVPNYPKVCILRCTSVVKLFCDSDGISYFAHTVHTVPGDRRGTQKANIRRLALGA